VRRILTIVETLDREDPEGAVEFFSLRHAKAEELMESLKALLSQKVVKYVIDQKGKQVKVEEEQMPGLSISADARTNSIIAKGVQNRLDKLREAIALLDVPAVGDGRALRTFALARLAPQEASAKLNQLYAKLPEDQRPTVLVLDDVGKVTIVGSTSAINEASALLAEIDGGEAVPVDSQRSIAVVALAHAEPEAVATAAKSLLNGRQLVALKMIPGPDRRSLIVAGTTGDVEAVKALVPVLDQPPHVDRTVRLARLTTADPQQTVDRARELYMRQVDPSDPRWVLAVELDPASRVLTTVGPDAAQNRFAGALRMVEDHAVVDRETRQMEVAHAEPSRLVAPLTALGRQLLEPRDGSEYVPPTIEAVDPLDLLVVTALPEQFPVLGSLVATLDRPGPGDFQLRVIQLSGSDPSAMIEKAGYVYERLSQGLDPDDRPVPVVPGRVGAHL
jgi:type II secretory pathway component GspD/PulD (secretin)